MENVYFRILSRFDPGVLVENCSHVFEKELNEIEASLHAIHAAFERLQEVQEAVATLEQGRVDVRRTTSLMATIASAETLHGEMARVMDTMEQALAAHAVVARTDEMETPPPKKRAKVQQSSPSKMDMSPTETVTATASSTSSSSSSSSSETESEDESDMTPTKTKVTTPTKPATNDKVARRESPKRSYADMAKPSTSMDADTWWNMTQETLKQLQAYEFPRKAKSQTTEDLTKVVDAVIHLIHKTTSFPSADMDDVINVHFRNVMISTTRILSKRIDHSECVPSLGRLADALASVSLTNVGLADALSKYREQMEEVRVAASQETRRPPKHAERTRETPEVATLRHALADARSIRQIATPKWKGQVANFIHKLQKELRLVFPETWVTRTADVYDIALETISLTVEMIRLDPLVEDHIGVYRHFLGLLDSLCTNYNELKMRLHRCRNELQEHLHHSTLHAEPSKTRQPRHVDDGNDAALREQLDEVTKMAQSWESDIFSLKQFDQVMQVLKIVMAHRSKSWNVRKDVQVRECVEIMASRVHAIKKKEHREVRQATIHMWKSAVGQGKRRKK